ncbi:aromatic acid exporter family protein, partial [Clostridium sp.]|uniref:FUSC family protein n=1 Tax=Clostridium sp. TaxID=1506 RepID=UPI00261DE494
MKILKLPNIGYRNIKTGLAVLICLLIFPKSLFAPIAAIISMQSTIEDSLEIGINRLIGTLIGGILGVIILYIIEYANLYNYSFLIGALSVSLIIYLCNLINKPAASSISSIVILAIIIDPVTDITPLAYSFIRTIETVVGVIIAIIINKYINPPNDINLE